MLSKFEDKKGSLNYNTTQPNKQKYFITTACLTGSGNNFWARERAFDEWRTAKEKRIKLEVFV